MTTANYTGYAGAISYGGGTTFTPVNEGGTTSIITYTGATLSAGAAVTVTFAGSTAGAGTYKGLYQPTLGGTEYPLVQINSDGVFYLLGQQSSQTYTINTTTPFVACFSSGTLIRTARGDVAVEHLAVGDLVVTASGAHRPIHWLGHRTIERPAFEQYPIRTLAGAFGGGLPERELFLSPGHLVLVGADEDGTGGVLVPIMCLINGTTIERVPVDEVTYWHVELDEHDIILAEGLPAESYLDWGDRPFFDEASDYALHNPDHVAPGLGARCRPVMLDGPQIEAEHSRLDAVFAIKLSAQCGWPSAHETFAGLSLA